MSKSSLLKNARNYAEYLRKKERGPVKAFFHITKNENVPAIEQQGLLTNHPNANVNSAAHPFRKHGTDAGGVWVTTEPTAFPVYGTTIGGKHGNSAARADALSTIKIEVPLPELSKMKAVQDPYGRNILRKGNDPRAIDKFPTWAGIDVPTTVLLNDVKPQWLKNIGYVEEEASNKYNAVATMPEIYELAGGWNIYPDNEDFKHLRSLSKGDLQDYSGFTGHRHGMGNYEKSPQRFVNDYIDKNQPITKRLPVLPEPGPVSQMTDRQIPANISLGEDVVPGPFRANRYSVGFIPADKWTADYLSYVKPGESVANRQHTFAPGAISRGIGNVPYNIKLRHFNWPVYKEFIEGGATPAQATAQARPSYKLDWDNIVYNKDFGYVPKVIDIEGPAYQGTISRGMDYPDQKLIRANRLVASIVLKNAKADAAKYLTSELGRRPTVEEIDNWARIGLVNRIEGLGEQVPEIAADWAWHYNEDIVERLTHELGGN